MSQISSQEPFPNPADNTTDLNPTLVAVCRKMTEKDVSERYGSMQEVVESLSGHQAKPSLSSFTRKTKLISAVAILVFFVISFFLIRSFFFPPVNDLKPEFVSIFNGKDLTGWEYDPGLWSVEDGAIVGFGKTHVTFARSKKRYRNFVLKLEFQLIKGNSGVFFRGNSTDGRRLVGYQADITDEPSKTTWNLHAHGLHGWIDGPEIEQKKNILKSIETDIWHDYQITAIGNRIEIKLDGKVTAYSRDSSFKDGVIGFQISSIETLVKFKDILIKELPDSAEEKGSTTEKKIDEIDNAIHITKFPFSSAEAKRLQQQCATALGIPVEITNRETGMRFRLIPPGEYIMGGGTKVKGHPYRSPPHRVILTRPFYIGTHEVTQKQFEKVMGVNPSLAKADKFHVVGENFPVCNVSWNDISEFCKRFSKMHDQEVYRLPTEAEWEYVCRAGSDQDYCFGNDVTRLNRFAWHRVNSDFSPHDVGQKNPNAFGIHDMYGNVFEFCSDGFTPNYYKLSPVFNPLGPSSPRMLKVFRGGSWKSKPEMCRSATRVAGGPDAGIEHGGFRVVLEIPNNKPPHPPRLLANCYPDMG